MGFALFFLAEYSNIILMSSITVILFLGGWISFFIFSGTLFFAVKVMFCIFLFVLIRGALPRYRYDQLMRLGWKVFLPISLALVLLFSGLLFSFNICSELLR
jgi:NADH-quinone oxidoreductase subunit H